MIAVRTEQRLRYAASVRPTRDPRVFNESRQMVIAQAYGVPAIAVFRPIAPYQQGRERQLSLSLCLDSVERTGEPA